MRIEEMLADDLVFDLHFCTLTTIRNLRGIPITVLREAIKRLHEIIDFDVMASPRLWTPEGSERTVVVVGKLSTDGKTTGQRFGLCVDTSPRETGEAKALYFWAKRSLVERFISKAKLGEGFRSQWVSWRYRSERKEKNKYYRYSIPIADIDLGEWRIRVGESTDDFLSFLSSLSGLHGIPPNTLQTMRPVLSLLGHDGSFISPAVIDLHRHPDITANETDDIPDKKSAVVKRVFSIEGLLRREAAPPNRSADQRKTEIHRFKGSELFSCSETTPPAEMLPFMNLSFQISGGIDKEALKGAGLYGVFFKGASGLTPKLIYVGLFRNGNIGSGTAFEGNILRDRWVKHIATCSMRGHNVGIGQRTARIAKIILGTHPLAALGHPDVANAIVRDRGCNAGENRVIFARNNWDVLDAEGKDIIDRFTFSYVRIQAPLGNENDDNVREVVAASEKKLKTSLLPICNGETPLNGGDSYVEMEEFEHMAVKFLSQPL
jgi:hypothetical protein